MATNVSARTAIEPRRDQDYPEWYQQVIVAADLAENSPVRGCMTIKPWGFGIWEAMQKDLDARIKATGVQNAYFPLFIPLSFLEREADHVEGFAKECAVVTHHRLEEKDGKLVPSGELEEPLVIRPTSETIIGHSFSKWIDSYRDLPLCINQWANVVRWEMRTRLFLRTAEFLWQEGHTVHATAEEAEERTRQMLGVYRSFMEEVLALPVIEGRKSPAERFPGAVDTLCVEAMMQDRKALQAGTSHYLGQNFSKACGIRFNDKNSDLQYGHTTSWGVSTRMMGGLIMAHSDDDGLCLPPRVAPNQVVIVPFLNKEESRAQVLDACKTLEQSLGEVGVSSMTDLRDLRGGEKNWEWIKKGVPIRIELGPKDLAKQSVMLARRDRGHKEKQAIGFDQVPSQVGAILDEMQKGYLQRAKNYQLEHTTDALKTYEDLERFFRPKNESKPEIHGGFVKAKWCGDPATEERLSELKLSIRCLPIEQSGTEGQCILTGRPATADVIIAKGY